MNHANLKETIGGSTKTDLQATFGGIAEKDNLVIKIGYAL